MSAAAAATTVWWVYGVVPAGRRLPSLAGAGLDPASPPELLAAGSLAAVAGPVEIDESRPDADAALARALAHEALLERLLAAGIPVVPFRYGAAFARREDVTALLDERAAGLEDALRRVDGRVELGVKASVDDERVDGLVRERDERLARLARELASAGPGAAHLRGRQLELATAEAAARERAGRAAAVHARLSAAAVDARGNPTAEQEGARRPVLNGAYLVARGEEESFRRLAAGVAREHGDVGLALDVTGPWPAYNFVAAER